MSGSPSRQRYRKRHMRMDSYHFKTTPLFDPEAEGFGITTSGDIDPVEAILVPGRKKNNKTAIREEAPVEDSFNGHYTQRSRHGRVTRENREAGNDRESGSNWELREQERELEATTPLDAIFRS